MSSELQQTLARSASVSGTSLHTGEKVTLKLQPAPVDFGLKFKRKDLEDEPTIDATIANLKTVERATTIGEGSMRVHTVEHVLSSLSAMGVDNAIVEMDANEPPIGDGSARPYVELIKKAGIVAQETPRRIFDVREPIHVETKNGSLLVLLPDPKFRISCTQAGPGGQFTQFLSTEITPAIYEREIAPARTFVYYEDVQPLMEKNLIKGGSLENAIVVRGEAILSKEPLRFPDEFVRHKIVDIIGDLALFGQRIRGHVIAVKPGHGANAELVRALAREFARTTPLPQPHAFPAGRRRPRYQPGDGVIAASLSVPDGGSRPEIRGRNEMHRREIGHHQRTVFRRPLPGPSGHARRSASGSDGPGRQHPDVETDEERQRAARLFRERRRSKIPKTGLSGRHAFHLRGVDQDAREATGAVEVQLRGQRRGRLRMRVDVEADGSMSEVQIHPTALVDGQAEIGAGTIIGPYCIVAAGVILGPDCWLQHHVTLCGPMTAGRAE